MECEQVMPRLPAYLDNEVTSAEHDAISAHLARCERCRAEKEQILALWDALREMPVPHAPVGVADRVMCRIGNGGGEAAAEPIRFPRFLPASAVVAAVIAITGLVIGGWMAEGLLNAEAEQRGEESIVATMDAFAPNPYGSFVGGYLAMLENPGRR